MSQKLGIFCLSGTAKKTVGFCALMVAILITTSVRAATCDPGHYLNNGVCTVCNWDEGGFYCPGDDTIHYCPSTDYDAQHLTGYSYWSEDGIHRSVAGCRAQWSYGTYIFSCGYDEAGYIETNSATHCMITVYDCPAGTWCVNCNENGNYWDWSHAAMVNNPKCFPVGYGYYSGADDIRRGSCPAGTSTRTTTAASVDECIGVCGAGITSLRAGDAVVPLWAVRTTSPAVHVRVGDRVCYGNLAPGTATGAINIHMSDTVYHLVP